MKKFQEIEGVLISHEEYQEYQTLLAAFAALRPATSFRNKEVEP